MSELYELPDGWEWKKLETITKLQNGFAFKSKLFVNSGLPIVRIKNIKNGKIVLNNVAYFNPNDYSKNFDNYKILKNDLLIAMSGATTGKIGLYDGDNESYLNQRVGLFRIDNSDLRSYLFYFLSTQVEKNLAQSLGAAQPNLSSQQINELEIPLPSLQEQKRIVAKLDKLFEKIDMAIALHQKNMDEADIFMKSVLNDVFGELEEKYEKKFVEELCAKITDGTHSTPKYIAKGIPFLSVKNISKGIVSFKDTKFISHEEHLLLSKRCNVEKDDVLYTKVGTTGIAKVVDIDKEFSIFVSIALLKPKKDLIYSMFFQYILNSPNCYEQSQSRTRGVANRNLVLKDIKQISFPLPPLNIQQKTVTYLDKISKKVEKLKQVQKEKMQSLVALKASILDQAFRGQL